MKNRIFNIVLASALIIGLTGCNKKPNPIDEMDYNRAGDFVAEFAVHAKKALKLKGPDDGSQYEACMEKKVHLADHCSALYKEMVHIANKNPEFRDLTVKDLTDKEAWKNISPSYRKQEKLYRIFGAK